MLGFASERPSGFRALIRRLPGYGRAAARWDRYLRRRVKQMLLHEYLVFGEESRLSIHETAIVNNTYFNLSSGRIVVEQYASIAHHVSLITGTHDFTKLNRARQT